MHDDLVGVEARLVRDRLARVFGRAGQLERLGPVEGCGQAHLAHFFAVDLWGGRKGEEVRFEGLFFGVGWAGRKGGRFTPRRVAFAAAEALALGLPLGFLPV